LRRPSVVSTSQQPLASASPHFVQALLALVPLDSPVLALAPVLVSLPLAAAPVLALVSEQPLASASVPALHQAPGHPLEHLLDLAALPVAAASALNLSLALALALPQVPFDPMPPLAVLAPVIVPLGSPPALDPGIPTPLAAVSPVAALVPQSVPVSPVAALLMSVPVS
jgi:hypothetical protein